MVSEEKSFESVDGRRTDDGGLPHYRGAKKDMVVKRYTHYTAEHFWDSQTSSPQTVLLTGLLGKTGVVVVMCVWGGGNEVISKLKGAEETHALPRSYLHVSCLP